MAGIGFLSLGCKTKILLKFLKAVSAMLNVTSLLSHHVPDFPTRAVSARQFTRQQHTHGNIREEQGRCRPHRTRPSREILGRHVQVAGFAGAVTNLQQSNTNTNMQKDRNISLRITNIV